MEELSERARRVLGDKPDGSPMGNFAAALDLVESMSLQLQIVEILVATQSKNRTLSFIATESGVSVDMARIACKSLKARKIVTFPHATIEIVSLA
jgi:hypothetical protein